MTPTLIGILVTLALAAVTLSGTWLTIRAAKAKTTAEEESIAVDTALKIIGERNDENVALKEEVADLKERVVALETWAKALAAQVVECGGTPVAFGEDYLPAGSNR